MLVSAPPDADGDPVLRHYAGDLARAPVAELDRLPVDGGRLRRQPRRLDRRDDADRATSARGRRRIAAEQDWLALGARRATRTQIFRLAGIYGPGRSAIDRLREGNAHRVVKPGQVFNRIHVDDIAAAVIAGIAGRGAEQIYNVTDDEPAPPQDVITFAAELLHMPPPPEVPFEDAQLSPMAASFYADNKRIRNDAPAARAWRRSAIPYLSGGPARHPRRPATSLTFSTVVPT